MSTDLTRSAQTALQGYGGRWSCEIDNFYLKTQLGLADFRVQSYEAVDKYMVAVWATWAYVDTASKPNVRPRSRRTATLSGGTGTSMRWTG